MQLITYEQLNERLSKFRSVARKLELSVRTKMMNKYTDGNLDRYLHSTRAFRCLQLPNISYLKEGDFTNKTFLDLGCGSVDSTSTFGTPYEPWLCRFLYLIGAKVIGVDINPGIKQEEFPAYQVDLMQENSLDFLPAGSVDLAHAHALFDSPVLYEMYGDNANDKLKRLLGPQLERIVKPEGVFLYRM